MSLVKQYKAKSKVIYNYGPTIEKAVNEKHKTINSINITSNGIIEDGFNVYEPDSDRTLKRLKSTTDRDSYYLGNPIYGNIVRVKEAVYK